jgi:hypothetical protein
MAGRQFSFFLALADQVGFQEAIQALGDVVFLHSRSPTAIPEECSSTIVTKFGETPLRVLIARRADLAQIKFRPISGRNEWTCDVITQPIIEFDRSFVSDKSIAAGRLYRVDKYWGDDGKLLSKPDSFIEWANRLYKLAKASLTKVEQGCYAGAEALELRKKGVAFEGLDIEVGSIKG